MVYNVGDRLIFNGDVFPVEIIEISETHVTMKPLKNVQPKRIRKDVFEQYLIAGWYTKL